MDRVEYQPLPIQDLLNLSKREELDLNPWYQRRSVWNRPQKAYLINTIFEHKPVPSLYIRHSIDVESEKSVKEVVDGQQRIRCILEYVEGGFGVRHPEHKRPVKYGQLSDAQKHRFRMTSLSVGYLMGATESDVIEIFGRLNSVAKVLNLQEKRNAQFSGAFKQFCLREGSIRLPIWRDLGIFTANDISRMAEIQFVSELVMALMDGIQDYSARAIDKCYERFDEDFPAEPAISDRIEKTFSIVVGLEATTIRDTIFGRAPLFYSLFIVLASSRKTLSKEKLTEVIHGIDKSFNSDVPIAARSAGDAAFYLACTSNMHRIKSRDIRDKFIKESLVKA